MQELDQLSPKRRQLGAEEDLQMIADHDYIQEEIDIKNRLIFNIQGLGGVRNIKRGQKILQAYIKGVHCQQSIRDLVKMLRNDVAVRPSVRLLLCDYNILESDLLQLLVLQVQDKKLSFWIIALLCMLTEKFGVQLTQQQNMRLQDCLRQYKQSFIKHECFQILMVHIADYYKTPDSSRLKAHHQMMQFIILLIRNLASIQNKKQSSDIHSHFLAAFLKEDMFNPLLFIIQTDKSSFIQKIDIPLMQIFYYTFACFKPTALFSLSSDNLKSNIHLAKLNKTPVPTRHSRFLPCFQFKNLSGVTKIVHKIQQINNIDVVHGNQKKIPVRMTENRKVVDLHPQRFGENFMKMQIQSDGKIIKIGDLVSELTRQFLQVEFQILVKLVFDHIFRESIKVTPENIIQYLLLCSWALQVVRAKYKKQKAQAADEVQRSRVQFNLSWIVDVMQNTHFELIYKVLFKEATKEKKKDFKINMFNAGLCLFESYIDVLSDLSQSMNISDRRNANVLMANVFRHDIAKILRFGFQQITHDGILKTLIMTTHKFFKLLSVYADGKILTIQTNKLLKKKKIHKNVEQEQMEGMHYSQQQGQQRQNIAQNNMFAERKYNQQSQFAFLAEYGIISKYMLFLKQQKFNQHQKQLHQAIFFYLMQIKKLLKGQWLFFQADYLCVFQKLMTFTTWAKNNKQKIKFIQSICVQFIKLLKKNELALVQSLFRYRNNQLKDYILKNYSSQYEEIGQQRANVFVDE